MRQITITRNAGLYGRLRKLSIVVDGQTIAKLGCNETLQISVPNEGANLYGKMDWAKTNALPLAELRDGDIVEATSKFSLNPFRLLGVKNMPIDIQKSTTSTFL